MDKKQLTRFELWKVGAGHTFFPEDNLAARDLLEPDAKLVWSVEARSWDEARTRMHEFLGWEPYRRAKQRV